MSNAIATLTPKVQAKRSEMKIKSLQTETFHINFLNFDLIFAVVWIAVVSISLNAISIEVIGFENSS